jgi:hypothetical protein
VTRNRTGAAVIVAAAALVLSTPVVGAEDGVARSFSIVVTTSPTGLEMSCSNGCAWTKLSYACNENTPCWAKVNERGVEGRPAAGPQATATKPFRLLITVGASGFSIQCREGCAWESLSYRCGAAGKCSATVDTDGVRGPESPTGATGQDGPSIVVGQFRCSVRS